MASSDFDPWESNNAAAAAATAATATSSKPEDNPLAVFDAADGGGGGTASIGGGGANDLLDGCGGTADLLGTGGGGGSSSSGFLPMGTGAGAHADVRATEDRDLFDDVEGKMEDYDLNENDRNEEKTIEIVEDDDDDDDRGGDDLLDMQGLNLRDHPGELQEGDYGYDANAGSIDDKTPAMDANVNGERNNRGFFGRWGSRRNNNSSTSFSDKAPDGEAKEASTLAYGEGGITGDVVDDVNAEEEIDAELEEEETMDNRLRPGDHVYIYQTYGINLRAYQRHAVVFSVTRRGDVDPATLPPPQGPSGEQQRGGEALSFDLDRLYADDEDDDDVEVTVVSFYHLNRHHATNHGASQAATAASGNRRKRYGSKREHLLDFIGPDGINRKKPIRKVRYGRKVKKGLLSQKAGVGTALKKDRVGLVLARVQYVLDNPHHLPDHNALSANGECASLWCVTGRWCTLQGASILAIMSVGQAGGALLAGGILSNLTMLVPMPGVWGMAGWWWYVPATVAYPFLVPMLVGLGMASLVPLEILRRNRKRWRAITDGINHEFWSDASDATKEEYFGQMATAEREAEMRSFFGVREGEAGVAADDAKYMPVGGAPGGMEEDDEDEAMAMQRMEQSCQNMQAEMDLSGKPPGEGSPSGGGRKSWGSFFRRNQSGTSNSGSGGLTETERFRTTSSYTSN